MKSLQNLGLDGLDEEDVTMIQEADGRGPRNIHQQVEQELVQ